MRALPVITLLLMLFGAKESSAEGFEAKTMRENLSPREVERPLLIGRGWFEVDLGLDVKNSTGYWDSQGEPQEFEHARFLYTTESLAVRYGVTRHAEIGFAIPYHYARLTNDLLNTDTSQLGMGDPSFYYRYELYRSYAPTTSVVIQARYKGPAGQESPASILGGPNDFKTFIMTTGTPDLDLAVGAKRQIGPASIEVGGGYTRRFSGLAMYISETDTGQFVGRIKPGDLFHAEIGGLLQLGPAALGADLLWEMRQITMLGTTSTGFFPNKNLDPVDDSDGSALDLGLKGILNLTRGVDLVAGVGIPLQGEDFQFFPIEDLHPTRGLTYSGLLKLRY